MSNQPAPGGGFRGNKAGLPSKACSRCGRPMVWRKSWAKNWDEVKFCSDACRRNRGTDGAEGAKRAKGGAHG